MSAVKWRPFCPGGDELTHWPLVIGTWSVVFQVMAWWWFVGEQWVQLGCSSISFCYQYYCSKPFTWQLREIDISVYSYFISFLNTEMAPIQCFSSHSDFNVDSKLANIFLQITLNTNILWKRKKLKRGSWKSKSNLVKIQKTGNHPTWMSKLNIQTILSFDHKTWTSKLRVLKTVCWYNTSH